MSKGISNGKFDIQNRDFYRTWEKRPNQALVNALKNEYNLEKQKYSYIEPFAGAGDIINNLEKMSSNLKCVEATDIEPVDLGHLLPLKIQKADALKHDYMNCDFIITNPPFSKVSKDIYLPAIEKFRKHANLGAWFLLPINQFCNNDFKEHMEYCAYMVPIGRFKFFEGSTHSESRDMLWYMFTKDLSETVVLEKTT